ncbi:class I SAM-dependent methyltransferase [Psychromicrobium sp. YIM B11713]|uniref:class I SAM-dependent methyltransferase n=1 Tax=Psychromicrobium sp. YIM B11713 TaxID=3145233 RepID=UPI00374F0C80
MPEKQEQAKHGSRQREAPEPGEQTAHAFDKGYWERHWDQSSPAAHGTRSAPPNPYLLAETRNLPPGSALDAGCGTGSEAIWLALQGWHVTGADISGNALALAAKAAREAAIADRVSWIETDLTTWSPQDRWDLVVTSYAHPGEPQLAFYQRISGWVAPAGSLLIVGHRAQASHGHGEQHPLEATATLAGISALLSPTKWRIESAAEHRRTLPAANTQAVLHDVVVRATRLAR